MRALAVVISGFLLAAPALAQPTGNASANGGSDPDANSAATVPEEDPNRRICRRVDTNTGSRVPYRLICMTAREWRAEQSRR